MQPTITPTSTRREPREPAHPTIDARWWASFAVPARLPVAQSAATTAECTCPTDCLRDHEQD